MRRGEALGEVVQLHRALGRIDRPVADARLARDLGRGEQVAVAQAADRPHPFAQRLVVEPEAIELERALDAFEGAHALEVGAIGMPARVPIGRFSEAHLFGGEKRIEVMLAGEPADERVGGLRLAEHAQRARAPVAPRGLAPLLRRELLDRREHLLPVARAQRRARAPCDLGVVEDGVLRARVPVECVRIVRERALPGDLAPRERDGIGCEPRRPCGEALRGLVGLAAREPRDREHDELLRRAVDRMHLLASEEAPRIARDAVDRLVLRRAAHGQERTHALRLAQVRGGGEQPKPRPGFLLADLSGGVQGREDAVAGWRRVAARDEERVRLDRDLGIRAREPLLERVARDLDILAGHARVFRAEQVPRLRGAERAQEFAAQALGERRAGIAREEGLHLFRVGVLDVAREEPIGGIGLEHMPREARPVQVERLPLAALRRVLRREEVGIGRRLRLQRAGRDERRGERRRPQPLDESQGHAHADSTTV